MFENLPYTNFHDLNLDWIIKTMKKLEVDKNTENNDISDLKNRMNSTEEWIDNYDTDYVRGLVLSYLESILARMIFVEITDEGYIVYHIPENWDAITFNTTGLDINLALQSEYGHLVLSY